MPTPHPGEKRSDYMKRCVPMVVRHGTAKNGAQAAAICSSMYRKEMKLSRDEDEAELMLDDTLQVERLGLRISKVALKKLRQRAIESYKSGKSFNADEFIKELTPVLTKAAAISHIAGQRRAILLAKKNAGIKFDLLDDVAKLLKKTINFNIDKIKKIYEGISLKALRNLAAPMEIKVRETINNLISETAPLGRAIEVLDKTLSNLGVGTTSESKLEAIYRTQLQTSFSAGRWQEDQDEAIQEILWGYKYVTAGDDRVREEHAALDGTTLPKDDPFWETYWPPNGWNCRCQVIPIFEEREVQQPGLMPDGSTPYPDKGFEFNPGIVLNDASS